MPDVDYFDRGLKIGSAYQEGVDSRAKEARTQREADDRSGFVREETRGRGISNDKAEYEQSRTKSFDKEADAIAGMGAPGATPGTGAAPAPSAEATGMGGQAPMQGTGAGVAMSPDQARAQRMRAQANLANRKGDFTTANKLDADALSADQAHIANEGMMHYKDNTNWDEDIKMLNRSGETPLTIGKDKRGRDILTIVQPNGTATAHELTEQDKQNIGAAKALQRAGFMQAALGYYAKVDAHLAATVAFKSQQAETMQKANEGVAHNERMEDAANTTAQAHMLSAKTGKDRLELDRLGKAIQGTDEKGNLRVTMPVVTAKGVEYQEVPLPAGMKPLADKGEVALQKTETGGFILTNSRSKMPLGRMDADGTLKPPGPDKYEGKKGQEQLSDWEAQGITRAAGQASPDQPVQWGWYNGDGNAYRTPEAAKAAADKAKTAKGSQIPAAQPSAGVSDASTTTPADAVGNWLSARVPGLQLDPNSPAAAFANKFKGNGKQ